MRNIGKTDKIIRVILGFVFVWLGWTYSPWLYAIAGILFITAATEWCLMNKILGINTHKPKEEKKQVFSERDSQSQQPPQQ